MGIVEIVLIFYFSLAVLYILILSIAGHFYKKKTFLKPLSFKRIAVFVPGYKEDAVILVVAEKLTQLDYPKEFFDIIIIADSFQSETLQKLSTLPVTLLTVDFDKRSKAKSLKYAFHTLAKPYDIAVILDADNITQPDFLLKINEAACSGMIVIQTQRVAKNTNTAFAFLDACSEAINNHLFRKGPNALGMSASLIGSGMAFDYSLLKGMLPKIESVYEDREIQLELARQGLKINFLEGVLVFDEKIDNATSFQSQRRRWIFAQFNSLFHNFIKGHYMLFKGNLNFYNFAVLNNLFPPRVFSLVLLFILSVIATLFHTDFIVIWWALFSVFVFTLAIALPNKFYSKKLFLALFHIPTAFLKLVQASLRMKGAGTFIHTTHTQVDIDSIFKKNDPN
ncbi:MAG: glycosyltransferase family 2 protein [Cyclobacteriaceae bacterium]